MQRAELVVKPAPDTHQRQPASDRTAASAAPSAFADRGAETTAQRELRQLIAQSPRVVAQRELNAGTQASPRTAAQRQQLHSVFGGAVKLRGGLEDREPVQGRLAPAQRQTAEEEEEPLQGRFETAQRQGTEEDRLQMKAAPVAPAQLEVQPPTPSNRSGLPDGLKTGIESLSGMALDHVQVHYNSSQPAQLNALAYAQGSDIHVAPGQERHLPHEAWHVVQQAQGRVKPTMQLKDGVPVNDDAALEREADVMGDRAQASWMDYLGDARRQDLTLPVPGKPAQLLRQGAAFGFVAQPLYASARRPLATVTVVQRALNGTYAALVAVQPEKGFRLGKTHGTWTDMLQAVKAYELLEARPSPTGNIKKHRKFAKELHDGLDTIDKFACRWLEKHEASVLTRPGVDAAHGSGDLTGVSAADQTDLAQLSAARNLRRRVAWEHSQITHANPKTPVRGDAAMTLAATDNAVGGQASRLDEVHYEGATGYYQPDALVADVTASAAGATGIPGFDPNWAGRSMAAARIDRLLTDRFAAVAGQAQVTSLVTMNFATHSRTTQGAANPVATTGVYLEKAVDLEMRSDVLTPNLAVRDETNRAQGNVNQVAMDDPVLQRSLNRLQILDAICGQVDRHMGNLFIDVGAGGQVTGVQGIDNDMAFGSKMRGDGSAMRAQAKPGVSADLVGEQRAWRGLPPIADQQVAQAIQGIQADDIRAALAGLIEPHEINATVQRLQATQAFLQTLPPNLLIAPGEWTNRRQELGNKQQAFNSYLGSARTEGLGVLTTSSATVKTQLAEAMEDAQPTAPTHRRNDNVPEWDFAESAILSDVQNLIGRGVTEATAIDRGKALARSYATRVLIPNVDRRAMTYRQAFATVDAAACAAALESARRQMYALWG